LDRKLIGGTGDWEEIKGLTSEGFEGSGASFKKKRLTGGLAAAQLQGGKNCRSLFNAPKPKKGMKNC